MTVRSLPHLTSAVRHRVHRALRGIRTSYLKLRYRADHVGRRALTQTSSNGGAEVFRKRFLDGSAQSPMDAELLARAVFAGRPWMVPIVAAGPQWIEMPRLEHDQRLDRVLSLASGEDRAAIARQVMEIALDLFVSGFAHRDYHARNLFWDGRQLRLVDFETLTAYPEGQRPRFEDSYDLSGQGLPSPYVTENMGILKDHPASLGRMLNLDRESALALAREILLHRLRQACATFKTVADRHDCRAGRIYGSFSLPGFVVGPESTQRDTGRRLRNFGVTREMIQGQSCLDVGCNVGAMLFELQQFEPRHSLGLEYDREKVDAARAVAAFAAIPSVEFRPTDVDRVTAEEVGVFDNVFCLALIEHVKDRAHLYELLGDVAGRRLFFEGNAGTSVEEVRQELMRVGFTSVRYAGMSDDDCRPENNRRPLFVATKD